MHLYILWIMLQFLVYSTCVDTQENFAEEVISDIDLSFILKKWFNIPEDKFFPERKISKVEKKKF